MLAHVKRHRLALLIVALVVIGVACLVVGLTARSGSQNGPESSSISQSIQPVPLDDHPSKTTPSLAESAVPVQSDIEPDAAAQQPADIPQPPVHDQKVPDAGATLSSTADSTETGSAAVDDCAAVTSADADIKSSDNLEAVDEAKNANHDENVKVEIDETGHDEDAQAVQKEVSLDDQGEESKAEGQPGIRDDDKDDHVQADHQPDQTGEHESDNDAGLSDNTDGGDGKAADDKLSASEESQESNNADIDDVVKPDDIPDDTDAHHHDNGSAEEMTATDAELGDLNEDSNRAGNDSEDKPEANDDNKDDNEGDDASAVVIKSEEDLHTDPVNDVGAAESLTVTSRELDCASDSEFVDADSQTFGELASEDASAVSMYESAESEIQGSDGNESPRLSSADLIVVNEDPSHAFSSEDNTPDLSSNSSETIDVVPESQALEVDQDDPTSSAENASISRSFPVSSVSHTDEQLESNEAQASSTSSENSLSKPDDCGNVQVSDRESLPSDHQSAECHTISNPDQPLPITIEDTTTNDLVSGGVATESLALQGTPVAISQDVRQTTPFAGHSRESENAAAFRVLIFVHNSLAAQADTVKNLIQGMWDWLVVHRRDIETIDLSHIRQLYEKLVEVIEKKGVTEDVLLRNAKLTYDRITAADNPDQLPFAQFDLALSFMKLAEMHQALFRPRRPIPDIESECFLCAKDQPEMPSASTIECGLAPAVDSHRSESHPEVVYCSNGVGCGRRFHRDCFLDAVRRAVPESPARCAMCNVLWAGTPDFYRDDDIDID